MRRLVLLLLAALCAPACDEGSGNAENTAAACRDGSDNDGDGFADCDDQDCWEFVFCGGADGDADAESSADTDADPDADSVDTAEELETTPDGDDGEGITEADEGGDDADVADDGDGGSACAPGDDGCGPTELCGDGLDNDCDGEVDEPDAGCTCTYGAVQSCLPGPPCGLDVGGCVSGWQACLAGGTWAPCAEAIPAADEIPDAKDNDCDGETDEGLSAEPTILCPVSFTSLPSRWWVLRCQDLCTTTGGPCDCTWSIVPPPGSGSVEVPDRTAETTRVHLDAAGNFIVVATILDGRLDTWTCSFAVRTAGPGFEADLWWIDVDPFEPGNIDLHVHRYPPRTPWFYDDDCHWGNCGGRDGTYLLDWGYADTPLADCPDLPTDRSWWDWIPRGGCPNPRLTLESFAAPAGEMFSVDAPAAGDGFRVAAHFYEDGSAFGEIPTDTYARISCAGRPVAQYGPVVMTTRDYGTGDIWRVADVDIVDASGECAVTPLGTPDAPDVQGDFSRDYF